jgi:hypothetical protein
MAERVAPDLRETLLKMAKSGLNSPPTPCHPGKELGPIKTLHRQTRCNDLRAKKF